MKTDIEDIKSLIFVSSAISSEKTGISVHFKHKEIQYLEKIVISIMIIKEKNIDIHGIKETKNVHEYNVKFPTTLNEFLKEQEYDLIKEVLL